LATGLCRKEVLCFLDAEVVVRQISGAYAIKEKELLRLFHILKDRERAFEKVTYNHVRRINDRIKRADKLVNEALNNGIGS
jgi:ribonuclease HI